MCISVVVECFCDLEMEVVDPESSKELILTSQSRPLGSQSLHQSLFAGTLSSLLPFHQVPVVVLPQYVVVVASQYSFFYARFSGALVFEIEELIVAKVSVVSLVALVRAVASSAARPSGSVPELSTIQLCNLYVLRERERVLRYVVTVQQGGEARARGCRLEMVMQSSRLVLQAQDLQRLHHPRGPWPWLSHW